MMIRYQEVVDIVFLNNRCDDKDCSRDGYYETLDECELRSYDLYQKIKLGEIKIGKKEL